MPNEIVVNYDKLKNFCIEVYQKCGLNSVKRF